MNIAVEKTGVRDGKERFVLVDADSGKEITKRDVSEPTMRKWLKGKGFDDALIDDCFEKARKRHEKSELGETDFDEFLSDLVDES